MNHGSIGEKTRNDTSVIIVHEEWDKYLVEKIPIPKVVGKKGDMLAGKKAKTLGWNQSNLKDLGKLLIKIYAKEKICWVHVPMNLLESGT